MREYSLEQIAEELRRRYGDDGLDALDADDAAFVDYLRALGQRGEVRVRPSADAVVALLARYADQDSPLRYQERIRNLIETSLDQGLPFRILGRFIARCRKQRSMEVDRLAALSEIEAEALRSLEAGQEVVWKLPAQGIAHLVDFLRIDRNFFVNVCRQLSLNDLPPTYAPSAMIMRRPSRYGRDARKAAHATQRRLVAEFANQERNQFLSSLLDMWQAKSTGD